MNQLINQLTEYSFSNPELLAQIKAETEDLIDHLLAPEAWRMTLQLEQKLKELASQEVSQPQTFNQYGQILIKLKFVALFIWDNDTFFDLIRNQIVDILGSEIDINERMTGKVYIAPDLAWPGIAQQTIGALRQNSQPIGGQQLIIKGEPGPRPPLVKYWISDYERIFGIQKHSLIEQAQYFAQSQNYQNLNGPDKIKIGQLLKFLDNLKPLPLPRELATEEDKELLPLIAQPRQKGGEEFYFEREEKEIPELQYPQPSPPTPEQKITPSAPQASPATPPPSLPTQKDTFREPITPKDLTGPQAPQRPAPRLNGNIIDLKGQ